MQALAIRITAPSRDRVNARDTPKFAKRHKSDARDAAAIVEAAQRPTMRFVAVKTKQAQARSMVFRTRGLLVRQRTQTVNAIRGPEIEGHAVEPAIPDGSDGLNELAYLFRRTVPGHVEPTDDVRPDLRAHAEAEAPPE